MNASKVININVLHEDVDLLVRHGITNGGQHLAKVGLRDGAVVLGIEELESLAGRLVLLLGGLEVLAVEVLEGSEVNVVINSSESILQLSLSGVLAELCNKTRDIGVEKGDRRKEGDREAKTYSTNAHGKVSLGDSTISIDIESLEAVFDFRGRDFGLGVSRGVQARWKFRG